MSCFLSTTYWVFLFHILHVKYGIKRPTSLSFFFIILASGPGLDSGTGTGPGTGPGLDSGPGLGPVSIPVSGPGSGSGRFPTPGPAPAPPYLPALPACECNVYIATSTRTFTGVGRRYCSERDRCCISHCRRYSPGTEPGSQNRSKAPGLGRYGLRLVLTAPVSAVPALFVVTE